MKILMLYGTKSNVTKDIARMIVSDLDAAVTLHNLKRSLPHKIEAFDLIVIGSPIYMGYMIKSVRKFVLRNLSSLLNKPVALFIVGADKQLDMDKYLSMSLPEDLISHLWLKMHLGGEFRHDKHQILRRIIIKQVSEENAKSQSGAVNIDKEAVHQFSHHIKKEMLGDKRV